MLPFFAYCTLNVVFLNKLVVEFLVEIRLLIHSQIGVIGEAHSLVRANVVCRVSAPRSRNAFKTILAVVIFLCGMFQAEEPLIALLHGGKG